MYSRARFKRSGVRLSALPECEIHVGSPEIQYLNHAQRVTKMHAITSTAVFRPTNRVCRFGHTGKLC